MKHIIKGKLSYSNNWILDFLNNQIEHESSLLDVGCGPKLYSNPFLNKCKKIVTIDAFPWTEPDILVDLEKVDILSTVNHKFDYILLLDFIEHLDKEKGKALIESCKKIVNKKIFLLTPLEEIWTTNEEHVHDKSLWCFENSYDLHKSIWSDDDFKDWVKVDVPKLTKYYFGYYTNE